MLAVRTPTGNGAIFHQGDSRHVSFTESFHAPQSRGHVRALSWEDQEVAAWSRSGCVSGSVALFSPGKIMMRSQCSCRHTSTCVSPFAAHSVAPTHSETLTPANGIWRCTVWHCQCRIIFHPVVYIEESAAGYTSPDPPSFLVRSCTSQGSNTTAY